jgi:predicted aspartyl protease
MIADKDKGMGRFSVEVELANNQDLNLVERGFLPADKVRRTKVRGVVDTDATRLVLPAAVAEQLGLTASEEVNVRYADGRTEHRSLAGNIHLSYIGRGAVFTAVIEPQRQSALIGAIVLEELDLIPDCVNQTLAPRDPNQITSEAE